MSISPYVQGMSGASAEQAGQNARPAEAYRNNALRTATSSQPPNAQGSASEAYASDVNALAGVFSNAAATINSSTASPSQQVDALLSVVMTVLDAQSPSGVAPTVQGLGDAFFQATQGSPLMKVAISLSSPAMSGEVLSDLSTALLTALSKPENTGMLARFFDVVMEKNTSSIDVSSAYSMRRPIALDTGAVTIEQDVVSSFVAMQGTIIGNSSSQMLPTTPEQINVLQQEIAAALFLKANSRRPTEGRRTCCER